MKRVSLYALLFLLILVVPFGALSERKLVLVTPTPDPGATAQEETPKPTPSPTPDPTQAPTTAPVEEIIPETTSESDDSKLAADASAIADGSSQEDSGYPSFEQYSLQDMLEIQQIVDARVIELKGEEDPSVVYDASLPSAISGDLANATDEELESLRVAIVSEQKSRIVSKISLDQDSVTIKKGARATIAASVLDVPDGVTAGKLVWDTSDKAVATVVNGNVTGAGEGTAVISCTTTLSDGTELSAECSVTVYVAITSISYKTKNASAQIGETYTQEPTFMPANATNKKLAFESSNPDIATVNGEGEVTIIAAGQVTITAKTTDGSEKSASYVLTIPSLKAPESFTVTEKSGESFEVEYFGVTPDDVKLVNGGKNMADVEMSYEDGKFTVFVMPKTAGTIKVTITDGTDKANQRVIPVIIPDSAVYSEKSYPKIQYKDAYRYPDNYKGKNVSFTGKVQWINRGSDYTVMGIGTRGKYRDMVYVGIYNSVITTPILENDSVTVYGTHVGNYKYTTYDNRPVSFPRVEAERIDVKRKK